MFHMFSSQGGSIYGLGGLGVFWYGVHDEFLSDEGIIQSIFLGGGGETFHICIRLHEQDFKVQAEAQGRDLPAAREGSV